MLSNSKIGIDLVYVKRMEDKLDNLDFINKVLTSNEQAIFNQLKSIKRKIEFLAGRFAAKEAYSKALRVGIGQVSFLDFEVLKDENNAPICNIDNVQVSISHDFEYAIAIVMIGGKNE